MNNQNAQKLLLEEVENKLEILMASLPSENLEHNKFYIAGWLDNLFDQGIICDEIRSELYVKYVG